MQPAQRSNSLGLLTVDLPAASRALARQYAENAVTSALRSSTAAAVSPHRSPASYRGSSPASPPSGARSPSSSDKHPKAWNLPCVSWNESIHDGSANQSMELPKGDTALPSSMRASPLNRFGSSVRQLGAKVQSVTLPPSGSTVRPTRNRGPTTFGGPVTNSSDPLASLISSPNLLSGLRRGSDMQSAPLSRAVSGAGLGGLAQSYSFNNQSVRFEELVIRCQSMVASRAQSAIALRCGLTSIVDDVLYLGAYRDACDIAAVRTFGIRAFLCVAAEVDPGLPPFVTADDIASGAVVFKHVRLQDGPSTQLSEHVEEVFAFIDEQALLGRPVALFCQQGKSRSASFAVAYLMREFSIESDEALALLQTLYSKAEPNFFFLSQLASIAPRLPPPRRRKMSDTADPTPVSPKSQTQSPRDCSAMSHPSGSPTPKFCLSPRDAASTTVPPTPIHGTTAISVESPFALVPLIGSGCAGVLSDLGPAFATLPKAVLPIPSYFLVNDEETYGCDMEAAMLESLEMSPTSMASPVSRRGRYEFPLVPVVTN
jgi:hypothetical protein